ADETRNLKLETGIQGGQILVSFETLVAAGPGYAGLTRHYQLQCCTSPAAADWTPVPGYEDIAATGNPITCEATASGPALCYRTRVWLAD
ncbi:MAG: hypothetical protein JXR37_33175, partial [Kiritimatiellae bacterium]|nr:hypothetical protein [Kiritimatiellia bacterium]